MNSVWVGEDHVVYVQGSGFLLPFTERYSRFRFRDIQCLAITETNRVGWVVLHLFVSLGFLGIVAAIFSASSLGTVAWVFIGIFAFFGLLFLAIEFALGMGYTIALIPIYQFGILIYCFAGQALLKAEDRI